MARQKKVSLKIYPNFSKKSRKNGRIPLYLKLTHEQKKAEYRLDPAYDLTEENVSLWDKELMRMRGKRKDDINEYLDSIAARYTEIRKKENFNAPDNLESLLIEILGKKNVILKTTLIQFLDQYQTRCVESRPDNKEGTKKNYRKAFTHFRNFLKQANLEEIGLEDFKYGHAKDFFTYMISDNVSNSPVSASSNIKKIKAFFNDSIRHERITRNPFEGVKLYARSEHKTPSLTTYQLGILLHCEKVRKNDSLSFYLDIFEFGCYTGLSFINIVALEQSMLFPLADGRLKLDTRRKKTGEHILQVIPEPAHRIIKKYSGTGLDGKIFPRIINETMNLKLKIIGALAGLNIKLSTKVSRTTCNQLLNNVGGFDPLYKKAFLGWSNFSNIQDVYTDYSDEILIKNTERIESYLKQNDIYL